MSVSHILTTLSKLERLHRSLLDLSMKKTDIIKENNMAKLDETLKNEQAHVAAIERLEQQRLVEVTDYLRAQGCAPTEAPTVSQLIEVAQGEEQAQLRAVRERLTTIIAELKQRNDLNQKMIFQSLQFVNITLDLLQPRPEQMNYGNTANGRVAQPMKKSYFESQA